MIIPYACTAFVLGVLLIYNMVGFGDRVCTSIYKSLCGEEE